MLLRNFGKKLGIIFQITDDLLDYFAEVSFSGKNIGDDFAEGKVTLPIIFLANKLPIDDKKKLTKLIESLERSFDDFKWVRQLLVNFNIKNEIIEYLQDIKTEANQLLDKINIESRSKEYLKLLVDFAINRNY
jgi:octaprenyl-diphosphate synthase